MRHDPRDALLTYLRMDGQPTPLYAIRRYMAVMHQSSPGATRTLLYRLCRAGEIERVGAGLYQVKTAAGGGAEHNPASLGY